MGVRREFLALCGCALVLSGCTGSPDPHPEASTVTVTRESTVTVTQTVTSTRVPTGVVLPGVEATEEFGAELSEFLPLVEGLNEPELGGETGCFRYAVWGADLEAGALDLEMVRLAEDDVTFAECSHPQRDLYRIRGWVAFPQAGLCLDCEEPGWQTELSQLDEALADYGNREPVMYRIDEGGIVPE